MRPSGVGNDWQYRVRRPVRRCPDGVLEFAAYISRGTLRRQPGTGWRCETWDDLAVRGDDELVPGLLTLPDGSRRGSRRWRGSRTTIAGAGTRAVRRCFAPSTRSAGGYAARTRFGCFRRRRVTARGSPLIELCSPAQRPREASAADLVRPSAVRSRRSGRSRSCAPSTACTGRCRSTRGGLAVSPATSSRRLPIGRCRWWRSG